MKSRGGALRLIGFVARCYGYLFGVILGVFVLLAGANSGLFGPVGEVCAGRANIALSGPPRPRPGAIPQGDSFCTTGPATVTQWFLSTVERLVPLVFGLLVVLFVLRFLDAARSRGPFADDVPGRLRLLGWFLIAGSVGTGLLGGLAAALLRATLLDDVPFGHTWANFATAQGSFWSVAGGVVALAFAAILTEGVRMREDLEGTV